MRQTYKQDPETKRFITIQEFNEKYPEPVRQRAPMGFISQFETFQSPITGKPIRNQREYQYDLKSSGSRTYEGRQAEQKEINRNRAVEDKRFERVICNDVDRTAHEIKHNYSRPKSGDAVNFTFGD